MDTLTLADRIDRATAEELGKIAVAVIDRLGQHGRQGAEEIRAALERELKSSSDPADLHEGLGWVDDAFGGLG